MKFDDDEVKRILARSMIARIATISARDTPQIMPLYFALLDGKIYMNNATTSPTVRNIQARPGVVLLVEDDRSPGHDRCLRITGKATFRKDPTTNRSVALRMAWKYNLSPRALVATLRNARRLATLRRYRSERASGMIEVVPESAEFLALPSQLHG